MLFPPSLREVPDADLAGVLRDAIMAGSTGRRPIDFVLAGTAAEFLVDRIRLAGLIIMAPNERPSGQEAAP